MGESATVCGCAHQLSAVVAIRTTTWHCIHDHTRAFTFAKAHPHTHVCGYVCSAVRFFQDEFDCLYLNELCSTRHWIKKTICMYLISLICWHRLLSSSAAPELNCSEMPDRRHGTEMPTMMSQSSLECQRTPNTIGWMAMIDLVMSMGVCVCVCNSVAAEYKPEMSYRTFRNRICVGIFHISHDRTKGFLRSKWCI